MSIARGKKTEVTDKDRKKRIFKRGAIQPVDQEAGIKPARGGRSTFGDDPNAKKDVNKDQDSKIQQDETAVSITKQEKAVNAKKAAAA